MQLDLRHMQLPARIAGRVHTIQHSAPQDQLWRLLHHKRWHYMSFANDDLLFAASVVSLGYLNKAFIYLADREDGRMRFHHEALWPVARVTAKEATLLSPGLSVRMQRGNEQMLVIARAKGVRVQLGLQERSPPHIAATLLAGGATHVTEKTLALSGEGDICGVRMRGNGAVDYSDGFVPRHTRWKWVSFSAGGVALNLTQGFVGTPECFAVIDDKHVPLGDALIDAPADPMAAWRVHTACGKVALTFTPFALHADDTDLKVIHAKFRQPVGVFEGRVAGKDVSGAVGVCEDQDVLW